MRQMSELLPEYAQYLRGEPFTLSASTAKNYTSIIRYVLTTAKPEDLTNPQMIAYLRTGVPTSYGNNFPGAWKTFVRFCRSEDIDLPLAPETRKIHFVHPIAPDLGMIYQKYFRGIPSDMTWQKFLTEEPDMKLHVAAQRAYEFFTGNPSPFGTQPLFPRSADSTETLPEWVIDSVLASHHRRTVNAPEIHHSDLNTLMATAGLPVALSIDVYRAFVAGYPTIRRRESVSWSEKYEEWERLVQLKDIVTLRKSVYAYCGIRGELAEAAKSVLFQ